MLLKITLFFSQKKKSTRTQSAKKFKNKRRTEHYHRKSRTRNTNKCLRHHLCFRYTVLLQFPGLFNFTIEV